MNMRKVGIIGVGHVGAHVALSLAMQGICDEIQLCDIDEEKIVSEQQDLLDAVCYLPHRVRVTLGKYEELAALGAAAECRYDQNFCAKTSKSRVPRDLSEYHKSLRYHF